MNANEKILWLGTTFERLAKGSSLNIKEMVKEGNLENQEEEGTTEQKYESKQLTIIFLTSYINHIWLLK